MDDFVLLVKDMEEAKYVKNEITKFLKEKLDLEVNYKSRYYPSDMGVNFCGYRVFYTYKLVRTRTKKKIKRNIEKWRKLNKERKLDIKRMLNSFQSWKSHVKHANSYNLVRKYERCVDEILRDYMIMNYYIGTFVYINCDNED